MSLPAPAGLLWRELGAADLDLVDGLNRLAVGPDIRPAVVKPESRAYFETITAGRGRFMGVFDGAALVGYGILQHDHAAADDPRPRLGLAPDRPVGRLAGARVAPDFRGRGLQRALIRARAAMAPADMVLFSTAAPVNTPSWMNLLAEGFIIRDIIPLFGGHARYLMVRDGSRPDPAARLLVDPLDTGRQTALFADGWRGYERARSAGGGPMVAFARPLDP